ncbi:MAG: GAF domain-containing protein [Anaerolineaceae bacterium]|nr:GAF domain-containing protein [Anaerolineaceae bacterium]
MTSESLRHPFPEPTEPKSLRKGLAQFWNSLTMPNQKVTEVGRRRQAALTASLALALTVVAIFGTIYLAITSRLSNPTILLVGGMVVIALCSYFLARTRHYEVSAFLYVLANSALGFGMFLVGDLAPITAIFATAPLSFLLAVSLLTVPAQIALIVLNLIALGVVSRISPELATDATSMAPIFIAMGIVAIIITIARNSIERARLNENQAVNQQLNELRTGLEQRISERTRDIALAAEVGRRMSRAQDTSTLVTDAVELIRERFELYYVQVYLVDAESKNLVLRAGTGEAGRELLERAHRLPLDLTSINGTAAIERHAVIVSDTANNRMFRPNRLLPETHSEMAVPLISGEQVLGVLNLQSKVAGSLSEENLAAYEVLAGQLASTLYNASLLAKTENALKELEARSQGSIRAGWEDYLDAIEQRERIAYMAEAGTVEPAEEIPTPAADDRTLLTPIKVGGETIGTFQFAAEQPWANQDRVLVETVAGQVAQQLENLRLLSQAERYQKQTEATLQRMTSANWEEYLKSIERGKTGFTYDQESVELSDADALPEEESLTYDLKVQDTPIGMLQITGKDWLSSDDNALLKAVSDQLSAHLENMRLFNTAQRELEERRVTETRLSEAQQAAKLASWSLDVATTTFTFNDDFYRLIGTTIEQEGTYEMPAYVYAQRFVHPEDAHILSALASDDPNFEYEGTSRLIRADGEIIYVTVRTRAETNAEGKIVRVNGSNQDVTEQFTQQQLLTTERQRLAEAQQAAKMANWSFDVATGTFIFNDEFYRLAGTSIEQEGSYEMPAQIYAERFVHPEDAHIVGDKIGEALVTTDPNYLYEGTSRMIRATGEIIYVTVRTRIQMDDQGKVIRLNGSNQDVTEQIRQAEILQEERARLSEALNVAKMAYWSYDINKGVFTFNDDMFNLFGTSLEEEGSYEMPVSSMLLKFIHPADRESLVAALQESAGNSEASGQRETTFRVIRGTGEGMTVLSRYRIDIAPNGAINVVGTNQDVTEQVRQQELTAQRASELATVAEVSTTISTLLDPEKMLQEVVDLTKERFHLYHAHIYLLDEDGQNLVLRAGAGEVGRTMVAEGRSIPMDSEKSLVARTARDRKGEIVNDTYIDPYFLPHPLLPSTASEVSVPLVAGDQLLGVLDVQDDQVGRFTEENVNVFTTLASQVAVSLQNSRSYIRAQQQAERESLINAISERIQSTTSVEAALQVAVRELGRALGAQRTVIQLGLQQQDGQDN